MQTHKSVEKRYAAHKALVLLEWVDKHATTRRAEKLPELVRNVELLRSWLERACCGAGHAQQKKLRGV